MKSREPSKDELARRRNLRLARVRKAEKLNIAVGYIDGSLRVMKQANGQEPPQLPKRPRNAA